MTKSGYDVNQRPDESLERYYRRLAKTADQRMVRLERAAEQKYYKPATQWAYARAQKDLQKWAQPGKDQKVLRWNTKLPKGEDLIAKINDIKTFLESPTSTKKGITEVYKKRADTVNKKYGTKFTWQQLAKYYDSGQASLWDSKFGSKTALRTIAELQKNKKRLIKDITDADAKDIRVDNKVLEKTVQRALKDQGLNVKDLL